MADKILIVDDDPTLRRLLSEFLQTEAFDVASWARLAWWQKALASIHKRSTRGCERRADGGAPSPGSAVDAEATVAAAAVLVGSFAGFGNAEAGGCPWIEFAYTPETEVHCEPTGALQA